MKSNPMAMAAAAALLGSLTACSLIPGTDAYKIRKAREPVTHYMVDPDSAKFREERVGRDGLVCGETNAKNRMGAYVGFKRFVSFTNFPLAYVEDPDAEEDLKRISCPDGGTDCPEEKSAVEAAAMQEMFEQNWKKSCT